MYNTYNTLYVTCEISHCRVYILCDFMMRIEIALNVIKRFLLLTCVILNIHLLPFIFSFKCIFFAVINKEKVVTAAANT